MIYDTNIPREKERTVMEAMGTRDIWIVIFDNYNTIVNPNTQLDTVTDNLTERGEATLS